jgi:2-polyprenyl-6-hydroxyphenyl methylase/3-demethylubiquinone-9 3-methyltransferase
MKKSVKWKIAQQLEYKWWSRYLEYKNPEAYLKWKLGYWQDLLKSVEAFIPLPEQKTVLDAGCGPAGIFMALGNNAVTAIDPLLNKYKEFIHFDETKYPFVAFQQCTIEELDEKDKFDYIFCINAINHVNDLSLSYDKLVDALKPGGYLVISTDAHRSSFLKKIFQWLPGDMLHPHQYSMEEYDAFLSKRNMKIIENIHYKQELIFDYMITIAQKL